MKPWDEEWSVNVFHGHNYEDATPMRKDTSGDGFHAIFTDEVGRSCGCDIPTGHLIAAAPALYRALAAVEWSGFHPDSSDFCPQCHADAPTDYGVEGGPKVGGIHASDCALSAALRAARGEAG